MADDPKTTNFANGGAILVALMSAGALLFNHYAPLQGARPPAGEAQIHETASHQNVDARLWQDPFAAIASVKPKEQAESLSFVMRSDVVEAVAGAKPAALVVDLRKNEKDAHCGSLPLTGELATASIIGVMVPGGPYAELEEHRRRARYAVVSALDVEEFAPEDPQHIGYFCPKASQPAPVLEAQKETGLEELPEKIPFEVFKKDDGSRRLVVWLNEDKFAEKPLDNLAKLFWMLKGGFCSKEKLQIIGPRSSDTLHDMIVEAEDHNVSFDEENKPGNWPKSQAAPADHSLWEELKWQCIGRIHFYAYGATAADRKLLPQKAQEHFVEKFLYAHGVKLTRTIATDEVLARHSVRELKLRSVEPGKEERNHKKELRADADKNKAPPDDKTSASDKPLPNEQHVALISEFDSFYGRTFPLTMANCFADGDREDEGEREKQKELCEDRGSLPSWVHRHRQLRQYSTEGG